MNPIPHVSIQRDSVLGAAAFLAALLSSTSTSMAQGGPCLIESIRAMGAPYGRPVATDGSQVLLQLRPNSVSVFEQRGPTWARIDDLGDFPGYSGQLGGAIDGARAAIHLGSLGVDFFERGASGWAHAGTVSVTPLLSKVIDLDDDIVLLTLVDFFSLQSSVSVLVRSGGTWLQGQVLVGDALQPALALSGRTVAIAELVTQGVGWIDIFEVDAAGAFLPVQRILPPPGIDPLGFGIRVDLDGERLIASTVRDSDDNGVLGALHVYERDASGLFQYSARIEDPPIFNQIPGAIVFGEEFQIIGDRIRATGRVDSSAGIQFGQVILEQGPLGWLPVALLDPLDETPGNHSEDALLAGEALFVSASNNNAPVRRYSIGVPQGVEICAGYTPIGARPRLTIESCTSVATGTLVVRAEGLQGGPVLAGLARGSIQVAPGGGATCIRPAGSLGFLSSVGPTTSRLVVPPLLVQMLPSLLGDVMVMQAFEPVLTPIGTIELAD
jgi:hypothetical protein